MLKPLAKTRHQRVLQRGDVVRLRSGGPEMVVCAVSGSQVTCSWFDGTRCDDFTDVCLDFVRHGRWNWN